MRISIITFLVLLTLSVLIDWGIFSDIKYWFRKRGIRRAYLWSSVALWIILIIIYLLPKRDIEEDIFWPMWMMLGYFSIYIGKLVFLLFSLLGRVSTLFGKRRYPLGLWIGLPLGVIAFGSMWWGALVGRYRMEVTHVDIVAPHLPETFEGYRITQFSDIHTGTWGNDTTFISQLVDTINAQHSDVILFTGDIVNRKTTELRPFLPVLSRLRAKDGVYAVLGNHDYGDYITWPSEALKLANIRLLDSWERKMGWELLNNEHRFLTRTRISGDSLATDSLVIIGVENWGEPPFKQYGDLNKAYPKNPDSLFNVNDSRFKILMTHNPEHWRRVTSAETNIDLTLSGHTHAMQIELRGGKFRWSPSQYFYKLWGGLYNAENKDGKPVQLYVNIGAGEVGMPFRIGATSEVTVFTLHRRRP